MITLVTLLPFIGLAIGGQIVHVLFKLGKLEKRKDFKFNTWWKKNRFATIASIGSAIIGVWYFSETITYELALTGGYVVDSIIKNAAKLKK